MPARASRTATATKDMADTATEFSRNLREVMRYRDVSARELAELSGVNKRTIEHYLMRNPQEPSVSRAVKLAQALGVTVEWLAGKKNSQARCLAD